MMTLLPDAVSAAARDAGGIVNLARAIGVSQMRLWLAAHYPRELPAPEAHDLARRLTEHLRQAAPKDKPR